MQSALKKGLQRLQDTSISVEEFIYPSTSSQGQQIIWVRNISKLAKKVRTFKEWNKKEVPICHLLLSLLPSRL